MGQNEAVTLFDELNTAFEKKLSSLTENRNFSTKKYELDALQFMKNSIGECGPDAFWEESARLLENEYTFIRVDTVLLGRFDKYLYMSLCYRRVALFMPDRGRLADGCKYLQEALYYCGMWQGAWEQKELADDIFKNERSRIENASKRRRESYAPIKKEVIRLLESRIPVEKWLTKAKAIEDIQTELWVFIEKRSQEGNSVLGHDNFQRTINDWSRNDDAVKQAFSKVVRAKESRS